MLTHTTPPLVAVIDGDEPFLALMNEVFAMEGYAVVTARHPTDALALLRDTHPDLLLLDLVRGRTHLDGLALLRALRTPAHDQPLPLPVIVTSTSTDLLSTYAAAFTAPHIATLAKPFDLAALLDLVSTLAPAGAVDTKERANHAQQTHALLPAARLPSPLPPPGFPSAHRGDPAPPRAASVSRFGVGGTQSGGTARAVAGAGERGGRDTTDAGPRCGNR